MHVTTSTDTRCTDWHSLWHDGVDGVLGGADVVVAELHLRSVLAAVAVALRTRPVDGGFGSLIKC